MPELFSCCARASLAPGVAQHLYPDKTHYIAKELYVSHVLDVLLCIQDAI